MMTDHREAVEAAKEYLRLRNLVDSDKPVDAKAARHLPRFSYLHGDKIARALLSLSDRVEEVRKEERERCAKVAEHYYKSPDRSVVVAARWIAEDIRSLSSLLLEG